MTAETIQQPFTIRGLTLPNRLVVPPMCMWIAEAGTGLANDEHLVHYSSMAESGVGLIIVEATAVQPCGPISPNDLGLYNDLQIAPLKRICDYVHNHSPAKIALQLAHAGRKGIFENPMSATPKHLGPEDPFGHQCVSASAIPHSPDLLTPKELSLEEIDQLKKDWVAAAKRGVEAGFDAIEIHCAHGYLLNQFTSPISNHRKDQYGGSLENRCRLPLEIAEAIRKVIPEQMPLFCRLSCVDWVDDGTTIEDSAYLAKELNKRGVDIIDCSSGGVSYKQQIRPLLGYQVDLSEKMKELTGLPTIAVGNITTYEQACEVVNEGKGDLVAVGRAYLANPYWWRTALMTHGSIPWHPARQMMGFGKSLRRLEAEKQAAEAQKKVMEQSSQTASKEVSV